MAGPRPVRRRPLPWWQSPGRADGCRGRQGPPPMPPTRQGWRRAGDHALGLGARAVLLTTARRNAAGVHLAAAAQQEEIHCVPPAAPRRVTRRPCAELYDAEGSTRRRPAIRTAVGTVNPGTVSAPVPVDQSGSAGTVESGRRIGTRRHHLVDRHRPRAHRGRRRPQRRFGVLVAASHEAALRPAPPAAADVWCQDSPTRCSDPFHNRR